MKKLIKKIKKYVKEDVTKDVVDGAVYHYGKTNHWIYFTPEYQSGIMIGRRQERDKKKRENHQFFKSWCAICGHPEELHLVKGRKPELGGCVCTGCLCQQFKRREVKDV
jgi:hypothetical protein